MSQVGSYNQSLVSRDKAARWLCVHSVLAHCTFKTLSWFSVSDYYKEYGING